MASPKLKSHNPRIEQTEIVQFLSRLTRIRTVQIITKYLYPTYKIHILVNTNSGQKL